MSENKKENNSKDEVSEDKAPKKASNKTSKNKQISSSEDEEPKPKTVSKKSTPKKETKKIEIVKKESSESEETTEESDEKPKITRKKILDYLIFIEQNVDGAQQLKGGLNLNDARQFVLDIDYLKKRFTDGGRGKKKSDYKAHTHIKNCCDALQRTGVFSIRGSLELLNALDDIKSALANSNITLL